MSARNDILGAIIYKLKEDCPGDLGQNVNKGLKFWDEVKHFPYVSVTAGDETREYLPGNFRWAYLTINIKVYVRNANDIEEELSGAINCIEEVIDANNELEYPSPLFDVLGIKNKTTEMRITSIITDEGLLDPMGVGDIALQVRYEKKKPCDSVKETLTFKEKFISN